MKRKPFALIAIFLVLATMTVSIVAAPLGPDGGTKHGLDPTLLIGIAIMLVVAKLGGEIFERMGQPAVLGELIGGIVIGNLVIFGFGAVESLKHNEIIAALAEIGLRVARRGV